MNTVAIDTRSGGSEVINVDFADRIISVLAVPYNEPTIVEYRGELWEEVIEPGAFDSVNSIPPERIRVNREHARADVVGACIGFDTSNRRSLVAHVKIARTDRVNDTLGLAAEKMLSASVGFGVNPSVGQVLDPVRRVRRVTHAVLDHLSLVMQPAYQNAEVLAVRSAASPLDHFRADPVMVWATLRTDPIGMWAHRRTRRG